ncbi:hypothetical protein [Streptomyces sp. NPDC047928]|uniref:hypothetical protein n=1 Tax=unclassified Streptomyces TaxID=2593676 RepID=UPI0037128A5A
MRAQGLIVAVAVVAAVTMTGCSTAAPEPPETLATASPVRASSPVPPPSPAPSVGLPDLEPNETVIVSQPQTSGSRALEFPAGTRGDALIVSLDCEGPGTVRVTLRPLGTAFPVTCTPGEVTGTHQQIAVPGAHREGVVSVEAPSDVRWSLTVGRGEPARPDGS